MGPLWIPSGSLLWIPSGSLLFSYWIPIGSLLNSCGILVGPCWIPIGSPSDSYGILIRSILIPWWILVGSLFGSSWILIGSRLNLLRGLLGDLWGTLRVSGSIRRRKVIFSDLFNFLFQNHWFSWVMVSSMVKMLWVFDIERPKL